MSNNHINPIWQLWSRRSVGLMFYPGKEREKWGGEGGEVGVGMVFGIWGICIKGLRFAGFESHFVP